MSLDGLIQIVGDRGSVWLLEAISLAADQRVAETADDPLDDGLDMAAEPPQPRRKVGLRQGGRRLQNVLEELGVGAIEEGFGR